MIDSEWIRLIHLVETTVLFGVGLTSAFHLIATYYSRDVHSLARVLGNVIKADYFLTTPAVLLVPITGFALIDAKTYTYGDFWIVSGVGLYILTSLCWIPAVSIQGQMKVMAVDSAETKQELPAAFHTQMRLWIALWLMTFSSILIIYGLMVFKPKGF